MKHLQSQLRSIATKSETQNQKLQESLETQEILVKNFQSQIRCVVESREVAIQSIKKHRENDVN